MTARGASAIERVVRQARFAGRQLWLAGLGAAAAGVAGAPRLAARGRELVASLTEKGRPLAHRQAARIDARIESLAGRAERTARSAGTLLRETAEYETRRLLERFDLATVEDLRLLAAHLEALDKRLDDYGRRATQTPA